MLVAGATGVVGRALVEQAKARSGIDVLALSRRDASMPEGVVHVSVDLADDAACRDLARAHSDVSHIVYTAWLPKSTRQAEVTPNLGMLKNLVEAFCRHGDRLRHVTLLQGAKAYGSHLGPFPTPARESDPRHLPPNFYYDQEDWLRERSRQTGFDFTVLRPPTVYGIAFGSPMNMTMVLAVYASISKTLGRPLRFPGTNEAYHALRQGVDAELLARAILWAGSTPQCSGRIYNVANGDHYRWSYIWEVLARAFDMPLAEPQRIPLAEFMGAMGPLWRRLTEEHDLIPIPYENLVSWPFGESNFARGYDNLLCTLKIRQHGFNECTETRAMLERQIERLRRERIIPT